MKKITLLVSSLFSVSCIFAQQQEMEEGKSEVAYPLSFSISKPLSEIAAENPYDDYNDANKQTEAVDRERRNVNKNFVLPEGPEYMTDESTIQRKMGTRTPAAPVLQDFAGQTGNTFPPDPSGAVGPNHYVQAINATPVRVYNKSGTTMLTVQLGNLWSPAKPNSGDPIVLYDKTADRWFIAQFSYPSTIVYIAVSKTPDPTGQYYTWSFSTNTQNDYLKFSIWHDGYYMTSNGTNKIYVFERSAMLTGSPSARQVSATYSPGVSGQGASFFCPLSADADGTLPTSGPCPMVYPVENAWGAASDGVNVRNMTTTWGTTPTLSIGASNIIPTNAHDMSYAAGWLDIPQPGVSQKLDAIGGVATFRAQWRKWTGYNTLLLVFSVKISSTQRAPKWVELRQNQTTGVWTKYQEGVYQPDTKSRFIPSIAMDDNGNIGMGYARSSSTAGDYPSLGYCGRLKNDPLGQMTIAETMVPGAVGNYSQVGGIAPERFGDYSQTSIDPSNGLVFWHTGQYNKSTTGQETRVFSFQLQSGSTGIDGAEGNTSIYNVYQSANLLNVEASKLMSDETVQVDLFDVNGKEVSNQKVNPFSNSFKTTIDVTGLSTGTYFVRIGNLEYQKVVKVFVK